MLMSAFCLKAANIKGIEYISINKVASDCSMKVKTVYKDKLAYIYNKSARIDFEVNQRDIYINRNRVWLGFPVAIAGGALQVSQSDYYKVIVPLLYPKAPSYNLKLGHIVLDAGHGGKDQGAYNKRLGLMEKNLTLDMANRVATLLRKKGYRVSFTRTKDVYIPLESRTAIANRNKGDLFVSLHYNATVNSAVSGLETFAMTPKGQYSSSSSGITASCNRYYPANKFDNWNVLLALYINSSMRATTTAVDRGVKKARFTVLTDLNMPGVLVECGFVSSNSEGAKIRAEAYREKIAIGIVNGILKYNATLKRLSK